MDLSSGFVRAGSFLARSLRPDDWEKFVLPGVMIFLLIGGAYSTLSLQEDYGSETLNMTVESLTERQVLAVREQQFSDSLDRPYEEMRGEIQNNLIEERNSLRSQPLFPLKGWLSRLVFRSGAFPAMPEKDLAPWGPEKEYVRAVSLLRYRTAKIQELGDRAVGRPDYSYQNFQQDVEDIKARGWKSEEVQSFLENSSEEASVNLGFLGGTTLEKVKSDGVDSLSFFSFLTPVLVTFLLYYLIGAVSVQGNIELMERREASENHRNGVQDGIEEF